MTAMKELRDFVAAHRQVTEEQPPRPTPGTASRAEAMGRALAELQQGVAQCSETVPDNTTMVDTEAFDRFHPASAPHGNTVARSGEPPPRGQAALSKQPKSSPNNACETHILEVLRDTGRPLTKSQVLIKLGEAGHKKGHAPSTVQNALSRLTRFGGLTNGGTGRTSKGYGLPEWMT
jgi:hypothetical protein